MMANDINVHHKTTAFFYMCIDLQVTLYTPMLIGWVKVQQKYTLIGIASFQAPPQFLMGGTKQENNVCTGSRKVQSMSESDATLAKCYSVCEA